MAFLTPQQLEDMGFASLGSNVLISELASIYGASRIAIGSNVRIDDFCVLSAGAGGIELGSYIHIGCNASLIGAETIRLEDFSGLSSRVAVYSSSDDYSGGSLTNPMVPDEYKKSVNKPVLLGKHTIVGAGSVILPGVTLPIGCAVGALSLVHRSWPEFSIVSGNPAKKIRDRKRDLLELESRFLADRLKQS